MLAAKPLTLDDIEALPRPEAKPAGAVLGRLRSSHHQMARLVASGVKDVDVAEALGYDPGTISRLRQDPSFVSLVEHYQTNAQAQYIDLHQRMAQLGTDAIEELQFRLAETPDEFSVSQLESMAKSMMDRVGFGPTKTINSNSLTAAVTPQDLARIREQSGQRGEVRRLGISEVTPASPGLNPSPVIAHSSIVHSPTQAAPRVEGGGSALPGQGPEGA